MTLFGGDSLVISLPGAEVANMSLPGSLAEPAAILDNPLSRELRSALEILLDGARRRSLPALCVARPEMFTHGMSEAWFRDRVSPASQHVCLSDGSTVKHLPGLPTYVFFYCLSRRDSAASLQKLSRRAPELGIDVRGQVNTCVTLGREPYRVRPDPIYLPRAMPLQHPSPVLLPFFLNRDSAEDSANRIHQARPIATESLAGFTQMLYLPLTETALDNGAFARSMTDLILQTFFDPSHLLVLRLPGEPQADCLLVPGITTLLDAVRKSGVVLPRSSPPNILFTTQDLEDDHDLFARHQFHVIVHDSFDFWRHSASFYAKADAVTVLAEPESITKAGAFHLDVTAIYGAKAVHRWVADPATSD